MTDEVGLMRSGCGCGSCADLGATGAQSAACAAPAALPPSALGRCCIAVCEHARVEPDRPMKDGPRPNGRGEARG